MTHLMRWPIHYSHSRSTDSLLSYNSKSNTSIYSYATQSETSSNIQNGYNVKEGNFAKSSPWLRKPVWAACDETMPSSSKKSALDRHLSLVDLICIGIAATVGSSIFVLSGLIAHDYAGWGDTPEKDIINRFQKPMQTMISLPRVISKA
jgi:hypothetical protein